MPQFRDICLKNSSEYIIEKAQEIGWSDKTGQLNTVFLEAENWGELKEKVNSHRQEADILVFKGGDEELNRKACENTKIDVLLHPEKDRKDPGINHVMAEEAAKNQTAMGLDFSQLQNSGKERIHTLSHWRKILKLCEKYETPYLLTTTAETKYELRGPRELKALIDSIGYSGQKALSETPEDIIKRAEKAKTDEDIRPGVKEK